MANGQPDTGALVGQILAQSLGQVAQLRRERASLIFNFLREQERDRLNALISVYNSTGDQNVLRAVTDATVGPEFPTLGPSVNVITERERAKHEAALTTETRSRTLLSLHSLFVEAGVPENSSQAATIATATEQGDLRPMAQLIGQVAGKDTEAARRLRSAVTTFNEIHGTRYASAEEFARANPDLAAGLFAQIHGTPFGNEQQAEAAARHSEQVNELTQANIDLAREQLTRLRSGKADARDVIDSTATLIQARRGLADRQAEITQQSDLRDEFDALQATKKRSSEQEARFKVLTSMNSLKPFESSKTLSLRKKALAHDTELLDDMEQAIRSFHPAGEKAPTPSGEAPPRTGAGLAGEALGPEEGGAAAPRGLLEPQPAAKAAPPDLESEFDAVASGAQPLTVDFVQRFAAASGLGADAVLASVQRRLAAAGPIKQRQQAEEAAAKVQAEIERRHRLRTKAGVPEIGSVFETNPRFIRPR